MIQFKQDLSLNGQWTQLPNTIPYLNLTRQTVIGFKAGRLRKNKMEKIYRENKRDFRRVKKSLFQEHTVLQLRGFNSLQDKSWYFYTE